MDLFWRPAASRRTLPFMRNSSARLVMTVVVSAACASTAAGQSAPAVRTDSAAIAAARADSMRRPYTAADVAFISGMIHHHAQAILIAGWAKSHVASEAVQTLSDRIINAQRDEIHLMQ